MTRAEFVQRGWLSLANEVEVVGRTIIGRMELAVTHATSLAKIVAMADVLEASGNAPWSDEVDDAEVMLALVEVEQAARALGRIHGGRIDTALTRLDMARAAAKKAADSP